MKKTIALALVLFFIVTAQGWAQFSGMNLAPGTGLGTAALKDLSLKSKIPDLLVHDGFFLSKDGTDPLSSSYLPPEGTAPLKPAGDLSDERYAAWVATYNRWSGMYSSASLVDGKPDTCWVEGASGAGIGETVVLPLTADQTARIMNGFQRSEHMYQVNARPKEIRISVLTADAIGFDAAVKYTNLKVVTQVTQTLEDRMGYQNLNIKKAPDGKETYLIGITILSVYPGTKYQDTCISEIDTGARQR
jgi:hypothetical protein